MRNMHTFALGLLVCALVVSGTTACTSASAAAPTPAPIGVTIDPPQPMPDFVLVNQDGQSTALTSLRGKPLLFVFAYTHCPDICPLTIVDFKRIKKALGDQGSQVNFAMITVDGERDTPEVLKRYLGSFDDTFIGLTGASGIVAQIAQPYGAKFEAQKTSGTEASYLVSHTSFMYLLDGYGRWRKTYGFQTSAEPIAADVQALLNEPAPDTSAASSNESLSGYYANTKPQAIYMTSPVVMPDFALTDQNGQPFNTATLRGHWALMYFGSTECLRKDCPPDVLAQWGKVKQLMGASADSLRFVMLSADPNFDTPAVLKAYLADYDKDFVALTGNKNYVAPLAVKYGVHIADLPDTQPTRYIPHSVYSVLLDPNGRWVVALPFTMDAADMAAALEGVMRAR